MATAKIVTWSRKDKNDKFPIGIKVSQNGTPAYLFEGNAVASRDHWEAAKQQARKAHPHALRVNKLFVKATFRNQRKNSGIRDKQTSVLSGRYSNRCQAETDSGSIVTSV